MSTPASAQTGSTNPLMTKRLVDIGNGRRMNIVCIGSGSPTVLFEYGLGSHLLHWQKVQQDVSALTTACFYDRAGYGTSDPSPRSMTAQNVTDDLYWLLDKAGVQKPFVLIGHSLGGLYATLYADRFPSQVAGLVLIEPSFAGQDLGETAEEQHRSEKIFMAGQAESARCGDLARQGKLSRANSAGCFMPSPGRTEAEIDYLAEQFFKPFRWDAMLSESRNLHATGALSEDEQEEQRAAISYGDKPMIVLTAGVAPKLPEETEEEHDKNMAHWKAGHDRLAARSIRGKSIVVPNAGHMIQLDQPQAVIDAVREVVLHVRTRQAEN
ncbi:MAG: alpha/beta hydrolase [Alphaproteobacteria bacterium]|nr:alpha/beta hydrolase [Alphaproteobacteria bacterium]